MRISLATKISLTLIGVLAVAVLGSVVAISSALRLESIQRTVVTDNLASVRAAEELEIALLEQRGNVSAYILDGGNTRWLKPLHEQRDSFTHWMREAHETARTDEEHAILYQLEEVRQLYSTRRDKVVELYDKGQTEEAKQLLLGEVVVLYDQAYELCEEFLAANQLLVAATSAESRTQVEFVVLIEIVTVTIVLGLGLVLLWLFFGGVIFPLRRLAAEARSAAGEPVAIATSSSTDEMRELGQYVKVLMADVAESRSDLEHSRIQLAHAEKLAAVGKLAASVAHEIRNPLTSMKMWVYSLRRSLDPNEESQKKLDIVSDEIVRLERIVRDFLEFSRPPQLKLIQQPIGSILDKTLELLQHRLKENQIEVVRQDQPELPEIVGDGEQLRQVLLNLLNNAMEAMPQGGKLHIATAQSQRGGRGMLAVRVKDTGPGMPEDVQSRVFEPFFTTKESGTGLGLCIAASVMARHGGSLELQESNGRGTEWIIWLPACG